MLLCDTLSVINQHWVKDIKGSWVIWFNPFMTVIICEKDRNYMVSKHPPSGSHMKYWSNFRYINVIDSHLMKVFFAFVCDCYWNVYVKKFNFDIIYKFEFIFVYYVALGFNSDFNCMTWRVKDFIRLQFYEEFLQLLNEHLFDVYLTIDWRK